MCSSKMLFLSIMTAEVTARGEKDEVCVTRCPLFCLVSHGIFCQWSFRVLMALGAHENPYYNTYAVK
jgi:hypothetical protein